MMVRGSCESAVRGTMMLRKNHVQDEGPAMSRRVILALAAASICAADYQVVPAFSQIGHMILNLEVKGSNPEPKPPSDPVNTIQEFMRALLHCYNPPPIDDVSQPVDLTFQVSFKRSGELFGKPRVVNFARTVSPTERQRYYEAVAEAINLCSPMPFTDAMGGASAGKVFHINIIDSRNRRQAMTND